MRIFIGKGYRVYFSIRNGKLILLLSGGNKDTQASDIKHAKSINEQVEV
jgi:probable addiction module antidote protein